MITVLELITALQEYPEDAMCYAYEGESTGVVIVKPHKDDIITRELGFIPCRELWEYGEGPSGLYTVGPKHE